MQKIMGIDYGDARTGVAISDLLCSIVGSTAVVPSRNTEKAIADIVRMAKDLNMCVLAEGVESKKDYDILRDLECDLIQGFLFDKPLSPKEFEDRLKKKKYCFF